MRKGIKIGIITAVVLGFVFIFPVYGLPMCCGEGNEQLCCDSIGKKYCPADKTCRDECPDIPPIDCESPLCLNEEGNCCPSCPSLADCQAKDMCRFGVDGCYLCSDCNNCRAPKCVNENDACCTTCPTEEDCAAMKDANGNSYIRVKDSKNKDCYVCEPLCQDSQCEDCHVCDPLTNRCTPYCTGDDVCCNEACCDKCITEEECEAQEGMYYYISAGCPVCEKKCDESSCGPCEDCSEVTNRCEWTCSGERNECCNDTCVSKTCTEPCTVWSEEECKCVSTCEEGQNCCKGTCVDNECTGCSYFDEDSCSCVEGCKAGSTCCGGECVPSTCDEYPCYEFKMDTCSCATKCLNDEICCNGECHKGTTDEECPVFSFMTCSFRCACTGSDICCGNECKSFCECYPYDSSCNACLGKECDTGNCKKCEVTLDDEGNEVAVCVSKCAEGTSCCLPKDAKEGEQGECYDKKCTGPCEVWDEDTCSCISSCGENEQCCGGVCKEKTCDSPCKEWDATTCSCVECPEGGKCCEGEACCGSCPSKEDCRAEGMCRQYTEDGCYECAPCCLEENCGACESCSKETNKCESYCPEGQICCDGSCHDTSCPGSGCLKWQASTCSCVAGCEKGKQCCGEKCVDTTCTGPCETWDAATCSCKSSCGENETCCNNECVSTQCEGCDRFDETTCSCTSCPDRYCCVEGEHCCPTCPTEADCIAEGKILVSKEDGCYACELQCEEGKVYCGGKCVPNICGDCQEFNKNVCECVPSCGLGESCCGGECVSNNCGKCEEFSKDTCQCEYQCTGAYCCDGTCVEDYCACYPRDPKCNKCLSGEVTCDEEKCFECDPLTGECKSRCENGTLCCKGKCVDTTCRGTDSCTSFSFDTCSCEGCGEDEQCCSSRCVSTTSCEKETKWDADSCSCVACDENECISDLGGCCTECPSSCPEGYSLTSVGKCYECQPTCNPDNCGDCETCDVQLNKCVTACADGFQCCSGECVEQKCENDCYEWNPDTCGCDLSCKNTEQCCAGKCVDTTGCDAGACMEWGTEACQCISSCTGSDKCCAGECVNTHCAAITGDATQEWDEKTCSCKECAVSGGISCEGKCCPTCPSDADCKADNNKCRVPTDEGCYECAECCVEEECAKTACHTCIDGKCESKCTDDEECCGGSCIPKCTGCKVCNETTGVCETSCTAEQECCGDTCIPKCDNANCSYCKDGACSEGCGEGYQCCGSNCVSTDCSKYGEEYTWNENECRCQALCGTTEYDSVTEGCCEGVPYMLATHQCCNGVVIEQCDESACMGCGYNDASQPACVPTYNESTQGCCDGKTYTKATEDCCNGVIISTRTQVCCGGAAIEKCDTSKCMACNEEKGICDYTYDTATQACCGGSVIDPVTQECCEGKMICDKTASEVCCNGLCVVKAPVTEDPLCFTWSEEKCEWQGCEEQSVGECCANGCCPKDTCCSEDGVTCCTGGCPSEVDCRLQTLCRSQSSTDGCYTCVPCCNGVAYGPNDTRYPTPKYACCNDKALYDTTKELCCNGLVWGDSTEYPTSQYDCCAGKELYDMDKKECCHGTVIEMCDKNACMECDEENGGCKKSYNEATHGCCDGTPYDKTSYGCCNGRTYDLASRECCGGEVIKKCDNCRQCDGNGSCVPSYDENTQECCGGEVIPKCDSANCEACNDTTKTCAPTYDADNNGACCNGKTYNTTEKICCGGNVIEPCNESACEVCDTTKGTCKKNYDENTQECCGGEPITKCDATECMACNETTKTCVRTYDADNNGACCNGTPYDKTTQECCNGGVISKCDESACMACDQSSEKRQACVPQYNSATQDCCNGTPYSLETQSCCGGKPCTESEHGGCCNSVCINCGDGNLDKEDCICVASSSCNECYVKDENGDCVFSCAEGEKCCSEDKPICCEGITCCETCPSDEECKAQDLCRHTTDDGCYECGPCCKTDEDCGGGCQSCVDGSCVGCDTAKGEICCYGSDSDTETDTETAPVGVCMDKCECHKEDPSCDKCLNHTCKKSECKICDSDTGDCILNYDTSKYNACCDGVAYDDNTHECCNGNVIPKCQIQNCETCGLVNNVGACVPNYNRLLYNTCCASNSPTVTGQGYDTATQECCNYTVITKCDDDQCMECDPSGNTATCVPTYNTANNEACCPPTAALSATAQGNIYDTTIQECCNNTVIAICDLHQCQICGGTPGAGQCVDTYSLPDNECCPPNNLAAPGVGFNNNVDECCDGKVIPKCDDTKCEKCDQFGGTQSCILTYDSTKGEACCGGDVYDTATHVCCDEPTKETCDKSTNVCCGKKCVSQTLSTDPLCYVWDDSLITANPMCWKDCKAQGKGECCANGCCPLTEPVCCEGANCCAECPSEADCLTQGKKRVPTPDGCYTCEDSDACETDADCDALACQVCRENDEGKKVCVPAYDISQGTACCEDKDGKLAGIVYNVNTQKCCNTVSPQDVCENSQNEVCCDGQCVVKSPLTDVENQLCYKWNDPNKCVWNDCADQGLGECCGTNGCCPTDRPDCCEGQICCPSGACMSEADCLAQGKKRVTTDDGCYTCSRTCGETPYGDGTNYPTPPWECCADTTLYDTTKQECCGGEVIGPGSSKPNAGCCNGVAYGPGTNYPNAICCGNELIGAGTLKPNATCCENTPIGPDTQYPNAQCCNNQMYGQGTSKPDAKCCGGTLWGDGTGISKDVYDCCGTQLYEKANYICCNETPLLLCDKTSGEQCCEKDGKKTCVISPPKPTEDGQCYDWNDCDWQDCTKRNLGECCASGCCPTNRPDCCEGQICCPSGACMSEEECKAQDLCRHTTDDGCYECGPCCEPPTDGCPPCQEWDKDKCECVDACTPKGEICCNDKCMKKPPKPQECYEWRNCKWQEPDTNCPSCEKYDWDKCKCVDKCNSNECCDANENCIKIPQDPDGDGSCYIWTGPTECKYENCTEQGKKICCGKDCCDNGEKCCTDKGQYCCDENKKCCAGKCCESNEECYGGNKCCPSPIPTSCNSGECLVMENGCPVCKTVPNCKKCVNGTIVDKCPTTSGGSDTRCCCVGTNCSCYEPCPAGYEVDSADCQCKMKDCDFLPNPCTDCEKCDTTNWKTTGIKCVPKCECCLNGVCNSPDLVDPTNKCKVCSSGYGPTTTSPFVYGKDLPLPSDINPKEKVCYECCHPEGWKPKGKNNEAQRCCIKDGTWIDPATCKGTGTTTTPSICGRWVDGDCCQDCGTIPGTEGKPNCCAFDDEGTVTHACCKECITKEQCDKEGKKWVKGPDGCYICSDCDPCTMWDDNTKKCEPAKCKDYEKSELTLKDDEADKCLECIVTDDKKSWYCDYKTNSEGTYWAKEGEDICNASKLTEEKKKLLQCHICHSKDGMCIEPTANSKPHNLSDLKKRCEEEVEKMGCEPKTTDLEVGPNETISSCRAICCDEEIDGWTSGGGGGSPNPGGGVSIKGLVYLGGGGGCNCYEYKLKESGKEGETCKPTTLGCENLTKSDGTYLEVPRYGLLPELTELITRKYYRAIGKDDKEVEFDNTHKRGPRTDVTNCCPKCKNGNPTFMACKDKADLDEAVCCGVDKDLAELGGFKTETCDGVTDLPICCLKSGEKTGVRVQGKDELLGKCCPLVGGEKSGDKWKKKPIPTPAFWDGSSAQCCADSGVGKKFYDQKNWEALNSMIVLPLRDRKSGDEQGDKHVCCPEGSHKAYETPDESGYTCCPVGKVPCQAIEGGKWTCCSGDLDTVSEMEKAKTSKSYAFMGDGERICSFLGIEISPTSFWDFLCRWKLGSYKIKTTTTAEKEPGCQDCYVAGNMPICCSEAIGSSGDVAVTLQGDPKAKYSCCDMNTTAAYWHPWNLWDWIRQTFGNVFGLFPDSSDATSKRECCHEPNVVATLTQSEDTSKKVMKCCPTAKGYLNSKTIWSALGFVDRAADGECCKEGETLFSAKASGVKLDKGVYSCCEEKSPGSYVNAKTLWETFDLTAYNSTTCCKPEENLVTAVTNFVTPKEKSEFYTCCAKPINHAYAASKTIWERIFNFFGFGNSNSNVRCCGIDENGTASTLQTEKIEDVMLGVCCGKTETGQQLDAIYMPSSWYEFWKWGAKDGLGCCPEDEPKKVFAQGWKTGGTSKDGGYLCCPTDKDGNASAVYTGNSAECCEKDPDNPENDKKAAEVMGSKGIYKTAPDGVYKCCKTDQAYWDIGTLYNSAECCDVYPWSKVYESKKNGENTEYACCQEGGGSTPSEWQTDVSGTPTGDAYKGIAGYCCENWDKDGKEGDEKTPTNEASKVPYWTGDNIKCCTGTPYANSNSQVEKKERTCCEFYANNAEKIENSLVELMGKEGTDYSDVEKWCCPNAASDEEAKAAGKYEVKTKAYYNGEKVECCDGEPYQKTTDKPYECCNRETHSILKGGGVKGTPSADKAVDQMCCEKWDASSPPDGKKESDAIPYWDGNIVDCCQGNVYQKDAQSITQDKYTCCKLGDNMSVRSIYGMPDPEKMDAGHKYRGIKEHCCPMNLERDEAGNITKREEQEAYWAENGPDCCLKKDWLYVKKVTDPKPNKDNGNETDQEKFYDCCKEEKTTQNEVEVYNTVVDVKGTTRGLKDCCQKIGAATPQGYVSAPWDETAQCCNDGQLVNNSYVSDGTYGQQCCLKNSTTPSPVIAKDFEFGKCCAEGQEVLVTGWDDTLNENTGERQWYAKTECCTGKVIKASKSKELPTRENVKDPYGNKRAYGYECCPVPAEGKEPASGDRHVVTTIKGLPEGEEGFGACCYKYINGEGVLTESEAYWNGTSVQCCKGTVYEPYGEGTGETMGWACCNDEQTSGRPYGQGVTSVVNWDEEWEELYYQDVCCPYTEKEDGTFTAEAYLDYSYNPRCCNVTYIYNVNASLEKGYGCCEAEDYVQKAKGSTRGVEGCCDEGGEAFVTYPWSSYVTEVWWEQLYEDGEWYGSDYYDCCLFDFAKNTYGGYDCCAPGVKWDATEQEYYQVDYAPVKVKDYEFEICCPEGATARYNGHTNVPNGDSGQTESFPTGTCCGVGEEVLKYRKSDENPAQYQCCNTSEGSNWVKVSVQGAPGDGFERCCEKYTSYTSGEGTMPEAYWNGSEGTCCKGTAYETREGVWACCEDTITTGNYYSHPYGQSVCDVKNAASGGDTKHCCPRYNSIVSGEVTPAKAYSYNGTSTGTGDSSGVSCCDGTPFHESNNGESAKYYGCCPEDWCNDGGYYGDYGYCWDEDWTSASSSGQKDSLEEKGYDCYEYDENYWDCYRSIDRSDEGIKGKITPIKGVPSGQQTETCCADYSWSSEQQEDGSYEYTKHSLSGAVWYTYCYYGCYSSGQCCYGTIYEQIPDKNQNNHMACCNEWDGYGVQTVKGNPPRTKPHKLCCGSYDDAGTTKVGKAYWDGSESRCCNGEVYDNGDGTYHCCTARSNSSDGKYSFKRKECAWDGDNEYIKTTDSHVCCQCSGDKIWDSVAKKCVSCPSGKKIDCTTCATIETYRSNWGSSKECPYGGNSDSSSWNYCLTLNANQDVNCSSDSYTCYSDYYKGCKSWGGATECGVCPKGETFYYRTGDCDYMDFWGCCKSGTKKCPGEWCEDCQEYHGGYITCSEDSC